MNILETTNGVSKDAYGNLLVHPPVVNGCFANDPITLRGGCPKHRNYKGMQTPSRGCKICKTVYELNNR
jgi:hypothetical protein